ncbi:MAG: type II toxin-antitoxin system VapC family toxin [Deltaproteobacteria bacterium]|nr:type II toxin-antitoxin system VapC family toxin [Deltaproteobacteria bacterium]
MKPAVLDASVAVKWFLEEPGADVADRVLDDIYSGAREHLVPELFFFEVLAVCLRRHPKPRDFAATDMPYLLALPITRAQMTAALTRGAAELVEAGLSGCDAAYAALAREVDGEWLTFDEKAAGLLQNPAWVRVLA